MKPFDIKQYKKDNPAMVSEPPTMSLQQIADQYGNNITHKEQEALKFAIWLSNKEYKGSGNYRRFKREEV